ncbi:hypothetical protein L596_006046 [Steinernema carpocapsae]|uniref:Uncharacterized protein n=1 Tax=Steinernema carpocapsae TaxID=34508 RepID=A0A4U8V7U9_STECR|nr:hypothetical protein L596_006046 [Steinernema carpocapsae]
MFPIVWPLLSSTLRACMRCARGLDADYKTNSCALVISVSLVLIFGGSECGLSAAVWGTGERSYDFRWVYSFPGVNSQNYKQIWVISGCAIQVLRRHA